jgi:hypothetical protein
MESKERGGFMALRVGVKLGFMEDKEIRMKINSYIKDFMKQGLKDAHTPPYLLGQLATDVPYFCNSTLFQDIYDEELENWIEMEENFLIKNIKRFT